MSTKNSHASCSTSGTLAHLASQLSDFKWKVYRVWQKGHWCGSHAPLEYLPPNTTMYHCVKLFLLLCFEASCSNVCPLTRCESLLHNKYRKGVLVCLCEMLRVDVRIHILFKPCFKQSRMKWVWVFSKTQSFVRLFVFLNVTNTFKFYLTFFFLFFLTQNFLLKLLLCDEWKTTWCQTSQIIFCNRTLALVSQSEHPGHSCQPSINYRAHHAQDSFSAFLQCWSQEPHFLLLLSVSSRVNKLHAVTLQ